MNITHTGRIISCGVSWKCRKPHVNRVDDRGRHRLAGGVAYLEVVSVFMLYPNLRLALTAYAYLVRVVRASENISTTLQQEFTNIS